MGRQYRHSGGGSYSGYISNGGNLSCMAKKPVNWWNGGPCIALGYWSRRGAS